MKLSNIISFLFMMTVLGILGPWHQKKLFHSSNPYEGFALVKDISIVPSSVLSKRTLAQASVVTPPPRQDVSSFDPKKKQETQKAQKHQKQKTHSETQAEQTLPSFTGENHSVSWEDAYTQGKAYAFWGDLSIPQKPVKLKNVGRAKEEKDPALSVREVMRIFRVHGYHLPSKQICPDYFSVPRLYLSALPKDLGKKNLSTKKDIFVKTLLPLILDENERISQDRRKLKVLMTQKETRVPWTSSEKKWVRHLCTQYKVSNGCLNELLKRVDIIPASLAVSQAAVETGWGTSAAARQKNSPFGMSIRNKVKAYQDLKSSVAGYMLNMNSNHAYKKLRTIRYQMRQEKKEMSSVKLASSLTSYSVLGEQYTRMLQDIIRINGLARLDGAELA